MIPILNPAGVQDILDYGLYGFAMSRFCGSWVAFKCVKENIESTASVDGRIDRVKIVIPDDFRMPPGGLNIRARDAILEQEARLHDFKRDAMLAFVPPTTSTASSCRAAATRRSASSRSARATSTCARPSTSSGSTRSGRATWACAFTRSPARGRCRRPSSSAFARGLDLIIVVEEKRSLIEVQVREELYGTADQPVCIGKKDEDGRWLFPVKGALDVNDIAIAIGAAAVALSRERRHRRPRAAPAGGAARPRRDERRGDAHPLLLPRLPAQHLDQGAGRRPRLCGHRLPLHGAVDGPRHGRLHPDGRRGRQLDRRMRLLDPPARFPKPRRRHLQPFRLAGVCAGRSRRARPSLTRSSSTTPSP